jgi:hypothetical protein
MSEELKACPFCGEEAILTKSGHGYLVYCSNCDGWEPEENRAIKSWNTRPLEDALRKQLKEMTYERDAYQFALLGQESPIKKKLDIAVEALENSDKRLLELRDEELVKDLSVFKSCAMRIYSDIKDALNKINRLSDTSETK